MSDTKRDFSTISIYIDENENMIGIPCGESDKYGIADIDKVVLLKAPYSDSQIESFVEEVISYCYTKKHNDSSPLSTIEIIHLFRLLRLMIHILLCLLLTILKEARLLLMMMKELFLQITKRVSLQKL